MNMNWIQNENEMKNEMKNKSKIKDELTFKNISLF